MKCLRKCWAKKWKKKMWNNKCVCVYLQAVTANCSAWLNSTFFLREKKSTASFQIALFWILVQCASLNYGSMNLCLAYEHINEKASRQRNSMDTLLQKYYSDIFYTDFFYKKKEYLQKRTSKKLVLFSV